jgi:hypothetical protein
VQHAQQPYLERAAGWTLIHRNNPEIFLKTLKAPLYICLTKKITFLSKIK